METNMSVDIYTVVYVVLRGGDCNTEVLSVYEVAADARIRAYNEVLSLYGECGLDESTLVLCKTDPAAAVEQWNDFWDTEPEQHVKIECSNYFARLPQVTQE